MKPPGLKKRIALPLIALASLVALTTVASLVALTGKSPFLAGMKHELLGITAASAIVGLGILVRFYVMLGRMERSLQTSEAAFKDMAEKYSTMFEASSDAIMLLNEKGFFDCNPATLQMFGCSSREEFLGKHPSRFSPPVQPDGDGSKALANEHIALAFNTGSHHFEWMHCRLDGQVFPADVLLTAMEIAGQKVLQATVRDISERQKDHREIEQALNIQRVLDTILNISLPPLTLKEILGASLEAILSIPAFSLLNQGAIFIVVEGEEKLELVAQRNLPDALLQSCAMVPFGKCLCGRAAADREVIHVDHLDERHETRYEGIVPHGHYCLPIKLRGELFGVLTVYVSTEHVREESETMALKTVADTLAVVIERKRAEEALDQMAHTDSMTGLPNRALFYDRLDQALALAQRHRQKFSVLFLDLDNFKDINDTLGHDMGDVLLKETADRLLGCIRKVDTVARMGGDEFTVILTETKAAQDVMLVAKKIIQSLSKPFELGGRQCKVGCSIGIAMYPDHGRDSETLIRHADASMYNAKRLRNTYCFFSDDPRGD